MDVSSCRILSCSKKRDFRSAAHSLLLKRDDQYNLRLNASEKCQLYMSRIYENALVTTHSTLFRALDSHLSAALAASSPSLGFDAGAAEVCMCELVSVSTDLSDTDRSNLLHHYLQMHLPRTTHTPTARHGPNSTTNSRPDVPVALPLLPHLVVATAPMTDCSRADICLAELVNSLQRQQKQQQARRKAVPLSFTAKSTAFFATAAQGQDTGSSKQSALQSKHISSTHKQQYHHLRDFLSPASLLRELYDDIVAERRAVALASDMPVLTPVPPLVLVFPRAERLDRYTLSSLVEQLQEAFYPHPSSSSFPSVRVILLMLHADCCAIPFPLLGDAQQVSSLSLLPAPPPSLLFDSFLSSLLSALHFLPVFLPLSLVHWLTDCFRDDDGCVWAAALRVNALLLTHFQKHQGLLCMYNNTSFIKEIRNGPVLPELKRRRGEGGRSSSEDMDAASREKVLQWLLAYADRNWLLHCTDSTHTALFDTSQHESLESSSASSVPESELESASTDSVAISKSKRKAVVAEPLPSAKTAAVNLDHRLFRQALDVLCFRVLKSIRNKFVRANDREAFASELIWEGVVTSCRVEVEERSANTVCSSSSSCSNSGISISPIVSDLLLAMDMNVRGTSVRKLLLTFQSWSALFLLLDRSYTTNAPSLTAGSTGLNVRGVPALWRQLEQLQKEHTQLVALLQEVVVLLDHSREEEKQGEVRGVGGGQNESGEDLPPPPPRITADMSLVALRQYHPTLLAGVQLQPPSATTTAIATTPVQMSATPTPPPPSLSSTPSTKKNTTQGSNVETTMKSSSANVKQSTGSKAEIFPETISDTCTIPATPTGEGTLNAEVDVLSLTDHLLQEVHSWTEQLVIVLSTHPRPPALFGILTLEFSPPEEKRKEGEDKEVGRSACLALNLRSDALASLTSASYDFPPSLAPEEYVTSSKKKKTCKNKRTQADRDTETDTSWLPDTATLFRCLAAIDGNDVGMPLLFDEFSRKCSFAPSPDLDLPPSSSSGSVSKVSQPKRAKKSKQQPEPGPTEQQQSRSAALSDEEMKTLQTRFLTAVNDLQRMGWLRMMASGDTVKRLINSRTTL